MHEEAAAVVEVVDGRPVDCEFDIVSRLADRDHGPLSVSDLAAALRASDPTVASSFSESPRAIGTYWSALVTLARPRRFACMDAEDDSGFQALFGAIRAVGGDCQCIGIGPRSASHQAPSWEASGSPPRDADLARCHADATGDWRFDVDSAGIRLEGGSIDMLFVGSLATVRALRRDFEVWLSKMSSDGIILFRDMEQFASEFGTWRLWRTLTQRYPFIEIGAEARMGVLLVGNGSPLARYLDPSGPLSILSEMNDLLHHASHHILSENDNLRARMETLGNKLSEYEDLSLRHNEMMIENADLRAHIGRLDHRLGDLKLYLDKYDRSLYGRVRTAMRQIRRRIRGM
ncbi:hypothetical protein [Kaistia terrae]|uniref:Class I SAM-dependent methyltransferase n=1 Tax=Kaistia terrae TaxID=537017 RepID=A0ABW0Q0F0_9HYPH|nr:hypothetical protein [Kaistia terrae]MCX5578960.1 hypothetical protein [Kaistia terrae]